MRKFKVNVDGDVYNVEVEELTAGKPTVSKVERVEPKPAKVEEEKPVVPSDGTEVKAPLPGQISNVEVKEGDSVSEGDVLFILEAMKMENEIVAPVSGIIKAILVKSGTDVDTDQVLAVIG